MDLKLIFFIISLICNFLLLIFFFLCQKKNRKRLQFIKADTRQDQAILKQTIYEIHNSLNSTIVFTQLLHRKLELKPDFLHYVAMIRESSENIINLLNRVMHENLDTAVAIDDTIIPVIHNQPVTTKLELDGMDPDWLLNFRQAVCSLDMEQSLYLISQLPKTESGTAAQLQSLIKNFRFDSLQQLCKQEPG